MAFRVLGAALASLLLAVPAAGDQVLADHSVVSNFDSIPDACVTAAKTQFKMFYGHTSHGSQIVTGMDMVRDEDSFFDFNNGVGTLQLEEYGDDLGHNGDTSWATITRNRLDQQGCDINLVMWSWCGGCSDNTEEGIDIYLNEMNLLESDYPGVRFVYMTGHLDGTGPDGNLYARNGQIRDYCAANGKILFDFADIESYDPDGVWYPDESDACGWCTTWCSSNPCPGCDGCAHSHCLNCYRKGKAFWWMLGALASGMEAGVESPGHGSPVLHQNVPNPFSPRTELCFSLPAPTRVVVSVHTLGGRRVAVLVDDVLGAGDHSATWNGFCDDGRPAAAGVYFCSLQSGEALNTRKMLLIR